MKLIAGKHNGKNEVYYWEIDDKTIGRSRVEVGDYAIVRNRCDYDLVKIIGITETIENYVRFFKGGAFVALKRVVIIVPRECIRED